MSVIYNKSLKSTADSSWGVKQIKSKGLHILLNEETIDETMNSSVCSNSKYSIDIQFLIEQIENLNKECVFK
tara:strand:+ start:2718 stop:2933 length:216 start_codon:yes stop_codon:yes gene_type:complete